MKKIILLTVAAAFFASACTTNPYTGDRQVSRTAIGAVGGAAAGAVAGQAIRGDTRGTLVGAAAGAALGGAAGGYMDNQNARLRQELQGTGVQIAREGDNIHLIMPGNITFDSGVSAIQSSFFPVLNSVARVLNEFNRTHIHITGHTDSTGSLDANNRLSVQRAQSVADYLVAQRVARSRMVIRGAGPSMPIGDNATAFGREQNRRVEIVLSPM
ncbi:MAG: OmpA family protein [Alphaproteobacteria bacterium]|nr:OmpA family protein [Alphaproteobacteria bacterium]